MDGAAPQDEGPRQETRLNRVARTVQLDLPLDLDCGRQLPSHEVAVESYGYLNRDRSNAILLCHGLTADQHAAGKSDASAKPGWWDAAIGPEKMIDTDRYFVLSPNVLGGAGGSTGPASIDPRTGRAYGMRFPFVSIGDMAASQARLADHLGIERFRAVIGGCMGGFQALEWMARFPHRTGRVVLISATPRVSTHTIALWSVMRRALMSDPLWNGGDYYDDQAPDSGMALLAMIGALFWMSRAVLNEKYGLRTIDDRRLTYSFDSEFQVEALLDRVAQNAAGKFDANALIYLTRAMDYFDLDRGHGGLARAFSSVTSPTLLISYSSDWRYPPAEMEEIARALRDLGAPVHHHSLDSEIGHGAYLFDPTALAPELTKFLSAESHATIAAAG